MKIRWWWFNKMVIFISCLIYLLRPIIYFKAATEPVRKAIYDTKIAKIGHKPNFMSLEEGVRRLRNVSLLTCFLIHRLYYQTFVFIAQNVCFSILRDTIRITMEQNYYVDTFINKTPRPLCKFSYVFFYRKTFPSHSTWTTAWATRLYRNCFWSTRNVGFMRSHTTRTAYPGRVPKKSRRIWRFIKSGKCFVYTYLKW